jgi:phosphate transport system substrate-binding protein
MLRTRIGTRFIRGDCKTITRVAWGVLLAVTLGISVLQAEDQKVVQLTGSKYMSYTMTDMATRFMQEQPNFKIVVTHAEEYACLNSLLEKKTDAIMVLRKLDDDVKAEAEEQGVQLFEQVVGWGAVAMVTDPKNPVNELTVEQVRQIFLGKIRNWSEVGGMDGPIVTMSRDEGVSGTELVFRDSVLQGLPATPETVRLFDPDIVRAVWRRKGSIADARYTEAVRGKLKGMVKILAIKEQENSDGVLPSTETIRNRSYPMSFPLVVYFDSKLGTQNVRGFVDFCAHRGLGPYYAEFEKQRIQ